MTDILSADCELGLAGNGGPVFQAAVWIGWNRSAGDSCFSERRRERQAQSIRRRTASENSFLANPRIKTSSKRIVSCWGFDLFSTYKGTNAATKDLTTK